MLLKQIEYFQAVVETGNFSAAGERCHISQSAISQQIKALESDLGVELLSRHNRTFSLTEAGELFYRKTTVLLSDLSEIRREVIRSARKGAFVLRIGYLKCYGGTEFQDAAAAFSRQYPDIQLEIIDGNHEDLYAALRDEKADLVLNDQRRAFSEDYVNFELVRSRCFIEIASHHPIARLDRIEPQDLKNLTCILIAGGTQRQTEETYYREIVGFRGDFTFAESLRDARILAASGRGFLPVEGIRDDIYYDRSIARVPLYKNGAPLRRNYCAFWRKDNSGFYVEAFADILKEQFS